KWINAFTEHAAFSTHYLTQGHVQFDDSDDEDHHIKPLGSMQTPQQENNEDKYNDTIATPDRRTAGQVASSLGNTQKAASDMQTSDRLLSNCRNNGKRS
ncbi:hypothetical protein ANN_17716, partial [Periplaneta americana]